MLIACGKNSGTLTNQMVSATFSQLIHCISTESDASFLSSLYKCIVDCLRILGGPSALPSELHASVLEATKRQLQTIADKRKVRTARPQAEIEDEKEDLALIEEMEEFALEDISKLLSMFDPNHALLIAISSVRELGLGLDAWDSEEGGEG